MSSIYQSEPPTKGKVVLNTTIGPIDIELWPKEAPIATRNFVQLCLDNFYNNCSFFRVIPRFIAQTGDPSNTGEGPNRTHLEGDATFANEFHSRLHFSHRGIVACAGTASDPKQNANQFFITLDKAPELEKKHTIFGKVVGDSMFNLIELNNMQLAPGYDDRLEDPPVILSVSVLWNPFDDLVPRISIPDVKLENQPKTESKPTSRTKAVKNFGLLSFGDEAEEDQQVFASSGPKLSVAPTKSKKPKMNIDESDLDSTAARSNIGPPSTIQTSKDTNLSSTSLKNSNLKEIDSEEEWEKGMQQKAKAWDKAERKADKRDAKLQAKKERKRRLLSGKTSSDEDTDDGEDVDEFGKPKKRKRKEGQIEDIDAPRFKKAKSAENEPSSIEDKETAPYIDKKSQKAEKIKDKKIMEKKSDSKPKRPSNEDAILAKLSAFKASLASDEKKEPTEKSWKVEALVFEKDNETQRDDLVVLYPPERKDGKPPLRDWDLS